MGRLSKSNSDSEELWFLLDAVDSGLSIDNVNDLKEYLFKTVIKSERDKRVYIIVSANAYELARKENCFDVISGKYVRFKDYEEYRDFVLKSKELKVERYA